MSARKATRKLAPLRSDDVTTAAMYRVRNPRPDRYYMWVALNTQGFSMREAEGFEMTMWSSDPQAPSVFGSKGSPGTPIVRGEVCLMSCDLDAHRARVAEGIRGVAERKARIGSRKRSALQALDGDLRSSEHYEVTSETSREQLLASL